MNRLLILFCVALGAVQAQAQQNKITREQYIARWQKTAVDEMEKFGIPASITMAQGLLESDSGNSRLAKEGNNHFGIKCKSDWGGERIYHDDDQLGECFRRYDSAQDSWTDHSVFLDSSERYAFLFTLDQTDYKGWAEGLKRAGYATDPNYPQRLIKIIEEHELFLLDRGEKLNTVEVIEAIAEEIKQKAAAKAHPNVTARGGIDVDNYTIIVRPPAKQRRF